MSQNASAHIGEVYRSVIADVINQMKEAFLDENIDIDVLQQLKKEWEDKVMASGAIDVDIASTSAVLRPIAQQGGVVAPPPMRPRPQPQPAPIAQPTPVQPQQPPPQQHNPAVSAAAAAHLQHHVQPSQLQQVRIQQPTPILLAQQAGAQIHHQQVPQHYIMQMPGNLQNLQGQMVQMNAGAQQFVPQVRTAAGVPLQQYTLVQPGQVPNIVMLSGQHLVGPGGVVQVQGNRIITHHDGQQHHLPQLDGDSAVAEELPEDAPTSSTASVSKKPSKSKLVNAKRIKGAELAGLLKGLGLVQLDGNGGGMDDTSSEEEDEAEDDDDPLKRIADRLTEGAGDEEQQVVEEDPLNSDDDQSDDEDLSTLFDAEDVIMCQFEKVHRARSKWKFNLKDGIMHIRGKDYCFQKCTGEAEW